jgi:hypothetical protein
MFKSDFQCHTDHSVKVKQPILLTYRISMNVFVKSDFPMNILSGSKNLLVSPFTLLTRSRICCEVKGGWEVRIRAGWALVKCDYTCELQRFSVK